MQGRFDEARRTADRVRDGSNQIGNPFDTAVTPQFLFVAHRLTGDVDRAERELRESAAILESMGNKGFLSSTLVYLAEAVATGDRYDEAEELGNRARDLAAEDDILSQLGWRAIMAKVLAVRGSSEDAEHLAREAVEIADATGFLNDRAETWMRLGEVLRLAVRTDEAAEAFREALTLFERKGNRVRAEQTRHELADLSVS